MLSKEIQETILTQITWIYAKAQPALSEEDIRQRIEIFAMMLSFAKECPAKPLQAVENEVFQAMEDLQKARAFDALKIRLIEPCLRLLCYVIDPEKFQAKKIELALLGSLYGRLDVLQTKGKPEREEYYTILTRKTPDGKPLDYTDARHPENVLKENVEIMPFIKAYCGRNTIVHSQGTPDEIERFLCMVYTLVETTYQSKDIILNRYLQKEISCVGYSNKLLAEYENKTNDHFQYIPLQIETVENDAYEALQGRYDETATFEEVNRDMRAGTILWRPKQVMNKVKIIGFAGMGKTTTIEHIIYEEVKELKAQNYQGKIPVLIEMLQVEQDTSEYTIESLIAKKLGTKTTAIVTKMLQQNMLKVYLDGINEIRIVDEGEKRRYLTKIEEFILAYPALKVVVTDRDSNEKSVLNDYPTFVLRGVTEEKIAEFITGNTDKPELVQAKIQEAMEKNPTLVDTLRNPFMLKNLIRIVECNKQIPDNEDDIAEAFLKAIVERERILKRDYKAPHILRLLIYIVAEDTKQKDGQIDGNILLSYFELCKMQDAYCDKYKKTDRWDNDEMLELMVKLGILKKVDTEKYTFTDSRYYNFLYYSADDLGLL